MALLLGLLLALPVLGKDVYVRGYVKSDGTYVAPHYRSAPNQYRYDNYSARGNVNPYTGQPGYKPHEFTSPPAYNKSYGTGYGLGSGLGTGSSGGYLNDNGLNYWSDQ